MSYVCSQHHHHGWHWKMHDILNVLQWPVTVGPWSAICIVVPDLSDWLKNRHVVHVSGIVQLFINFYNNINQGNVLIVCEKKTIRNLFFSLILYGFVLQILLMYYVAICFKSSRWFLTLGIWFFFVINFIILFLGQKHKLLSMIIVVCVT